MITAESLPNPNSYPSFSGVRALTTISAQGVYVQFEQFVYHFTCDSPVPAGRPCRWDTLEQQLSDQVRHSVMMYLPPEYSCNKTTSGNIRKCTPISKFIESFKFEAKQVKISFLVEIIKVII